MAQVTPDYEAPWWCAGAHMQTVWPAKAMIKPDVLYTRERVTTPDNDFVLWDWVEPPAATPTTPVIVLFHGLEGSSQSHYALSMMQVAKLMGYRGVVAQYRSCGGEINLLPRFYHAGDTPYVDFVLSTLKARYPEAPLWVVGVSLGGALLCRYLGEYGSKSKADKAVSVGAPYELWISQVAIRQGWSKLYEKHLLSTLLEKTAQKQAVYPELLGNIDLKTIHSFYDFDEVVTAPLHGFRGRDDYWHRVCAKTVLPEITIPTLLLSAQNDPFYQASALPTEADVSPSVTLDYPLEGGHIGFPFGRMPGHLGYLPMRCLRFFLSGQ